jgi:hypothetical protein
VPNSQNEYPVCLFFNVLLISSVTHIFCRKNLVHGDKLLLNKAYPGKFHGAITAFMHACGIQLLLNDLIDTLPAQGESSDYARNNVEG